jgi:hypothetical protein
MRDLAFPHRSAFRFVIDPDYFSIPEEEIPNIRVVVTVVGGKTLHLTPDFAKEIGMQAVGRATWPARSLDSCFARPEFTTTREK